jgi:hypothetical protein
MRLRDRAVERVLWRRVRRELKASSVLRAEYRRAHAGRRRWLSEGWWRHLLVPLLGFVWMQGLLGVSEDVWPALATLAFWWMGITGVSALRILGALYDSAAVTALFHLPMTDQEIFEVRRRGQIGRVFLLALLYLPVGLLLAQAWGEGMMERLTLLILPSGQYVLAFACAVHVAAWIPRVSRTLCFAGFPLALVLLWGWQHYRDWMPMLVHAGKWLPPFGWVHQAVYLGQVGGEPAAGWWLLPVSVLVILVPVSWRRLRENYVLAEPMLDLTSTESDVETEVDVEPVRTIRSAGDVADSPDEVLPFFGAGTWSTESAAANQGGAWLEQWIRRRCWTDNDCRVADFFIGETQEWTATFARMLKVFAGALLLVVVLGEMGPLVVVAAAVLTASMGMPLVGGEWRGFELRSTGGMYLPMYGLYPVGFGEIARLMLKSNLVRVGLGLPFILILAAVGSWRLTGSVQFGLVYAVKAAALYVAAMPVIVALRFSSCTNDTQRPRFWVVLWLLAQVLIALGTGLTFFLAVTPKVAWISLGIFAVTNIVALFAYGRAWARGDFDLLTNRPEDEMNR